MVERSEFDPWARKIQAAKGDVGWFLCASPGFRETVRTCDWRPSVNVNCHFLLAAWLILTFPTFLFKLTPCCLTLYLPL